MLGRYIGRQGMSQVGSGSDDGICRCDCWRCDVFVLEKHRCRILCGASLGDPHSPASVVFRQSTKYPTFALVLCEAFAPVWFVVYQGFYANGHEWEGIVVMVAIQMCICREFGMYIGLSQKLSWRSICGSVWHQRCKGDFSAVPLSAAMKWSFHVWIAFSARL